MARLFQLSDLKNVVVEEIQQLENYDRDRPEFDNKYLKMLYFFAKEGIFPTLKKFNAHRKKQQRFLTFMFTKVGNERYINISVQSQKDPDKFVIANEFFNVTDIDLSLPSENLEEYFLKYNQYCSHEDYSEFGIDVSQTHSYQVENGASQEHFEDGLFVYGLGGYVSMFIMHHFRKMRKLGCIDYKAEVMEDFRRKYGFEKGFLVPEQSHALLNNVEQPVVIISTYHSDHARIAKEIFEVNPKSYILIEKPPTVTLDDLEILVDLYNKKARLEMGFNRRFIPFNHYIKKQVQARPVIITCSIKEVNISSNHWYLWSNQGTRITGNVVHWFDLANYWIDSNPKEVQVLADPGDPESSAISVLYRDGSLLNISASDKGNSMRGVQERIEVRMGNETIFVDDYTVLTHYRKNGIRSRKRKLLRKKGHSEMYRNFKRIITGDFTSEYTVRDLVRTSVVTFAASTLIQEGGHSRNIEDLIDSYLKAASATEIN